MAWAHSDKTAIVGVGGTPYYRRGASQPQTLIELCGKAIIAACDDAGINVSDIDGFAFYSGAGAGYGNSMDTYALMETLGIPEVGFTATLTGGGGGSAGAVGLATAAIMSGQSKYVVTLLGLQQAVLRLGTVFASAPSTPENAFLQPSGLLGPGYLMAILARRHMHKFGTRRDAFCEIAMSQRLNAMNRPKAIRKEPMTKEDYFNARMIADPHCLFDFCLEFEGAVAVITTTTERAKDLKQKPVLVHSCASGGVRDWGRAFTWYQMPDDLFTTSGHGSVAQRLYDQVGLSAKDVDVALLYDHFSSMVMMQLEDYGFCKKGEGGPFVESGAIRFKGGSIPVNTHGGQLSEGYIIGMTHIMEGVEQLRGTAINQVKDADIALVTGGPAPIPVSGLLLRRAS